MAKPLKKSKTPKGKTLTLDFTNVESRDVLPEGTYVVKVDKVTEEEGAKAPYLKWELSVTQGDHKNRKLWHNTSLAPQALWSLRGLLEALGMEIPTGVYKLDLKQLIGLPVAVTIEHRTYQNKVQSKIIDIFPVGDLDDEEADDEEEVDEDEEDEEDWEEEEEEEEDTEE